MTVTRITAWIRRSRTSGPRAVVPESWPVVGRKVAQLGGFVIEAEGRSVFHCGDSAYFDGFREIGKRFDIEIALLPIGAYDPPSGREVHMNPEQAVQAFEELGAKTLVPMHYGTFRLGYEPLDEPPARLLARAREHGVEKKVLVMTEGTPVVL